jgi:hypothetical protein
MNRVTADDIKPVLDEMALFAAKLSPMLVKFGAKGIKISGLEGG